MAKPVVLIIMDGWGLAPKSPGNAVTQAKTPNLNRLWAAYPKTKLIASGELVGLPRGEPGNSETGHLNLGAGRIIFQDLPRINMAIANNSFANNPAFKAAIEHTFKNQAKLHLLGLLSSGGVHSSLEHLIALIQLAKKEKVNKLFLHLFTDGRDSPPNASANFIAQLEGQLQQIGIGKIATLTGRYYAMDRDHRWDRTQKTYEALIEGRGETSGDTMTAVKNSYLNGKTDEFIEPTILAKEGLIEDNDAAIFFNFRIDRPRQLTEALVLPDFETRKSEKAPFDPYAERYGLKVYQPPVGTNTFHRQKVLKNFFLVTMTEYEKELPVQIAFPPQPVKMPLARILAENNLRQLHLAETEKERFVNYYFDGLQEKPFPGEDRIEIPSPQVATYDQKPEMSAYQVTEELERQLKKQIYDFIVVNFANPDMVGHTGVLEAGIKACEVVDECVGRITKLALSQSGSCLITADHGNVEEMINLATGEVDTEHSHNPVPLIIVDQSFFQKTTVLNQGILADVAPTTLALLGINRPEITTGKNLLAQL